MNGFRLYGRYVAASVRGTMEYRASFLLTLLGRFIVAFSGFFAVNFLFGSFTQIKGYGYADVLLCFAVMELGFAIAECVSCGMDRFSALIRRGGFDILLVRPRHTILQVMGSRFELGFLGPMISGCVVLAVAIGRQTIAWTPLRVCTLALMIAGSAALFSGLFMIGAAICFFAVEQSSALNVLTYGGREHGRYPIDIYGKGLFRFCTFVVPYTLVQYYPLQYLTGRTERWAFGLYPLGIVGFLLICYAIWRAGERHYASCG